MRIERFLILGSQFLGIWILMKRLTWCNCTSLRQVSRYCSLSMSNILISLRAIVFPSCVLFALKTYENFPWPICKINLVSPSKLLSLLSHLPISFCISNPLTTIPTWCSTFWVLFNSLSFLLSLPSLFPEGAIYGLLLLLLAGLLVLDILY